MCECHLGTVMAPIKAELRKCSVNVRKCHPMNRKDLCYSGVLAWKAAGFETIT